MPVRREPLSGTSLSEEHNSEFLDFVDGLEADADVLRGRLSDLETEVAALGQTVQSTGQTVQNFLNSETRIPLFPFFANNWEVEDGLADSSVISTSKNARYEAQWADGRLQRGSVRFVVVDGGGNDVLTCTVIRVGVGQLGVAQSAGTGGEENVDVAFASPQVGPAIYVFRVETPNRNRTYRLRDIVLRRD